MFYFWVWFNVAVELGFSFLLWKVIVQWLLVGQSWTGREEFAVGVRLVVCGSCDSWRVSGAK